MSDVGGANDDAIARLGARVDRLESILAVQTPVREYLARCDVIDRGDPADRSAAAARIAELFTADAVWEGVGRSRLEFPRLEGRSAIEALFSPKPGSLRFLRNFHFLTTPRIEVEGDRASGAWTLLCAVTYGDGRSVWRVARNAVDFARREGAWLISHFRAETLYCGPHPMESLAQAGPSGDSGATR